MSGPRSQVSARLSIRTCALLLLVFGTAAAQEKITSPKEQFGFNIGDDYQLVNYTRLLEYWKKLDRQSDRLLVVDIGKTAEGRPIAMAIITSPENHKRLTRLRDISKKLALAEGLSQDEARALAREGKAVVWVDGGLHATEVLGSQHLLQLVYDMVSRNDPETLRFLNDDILLATCVNPDGLELVADWYMREPDPLKRSTGGIPRLYQKYIGHDNNRDFYISSQPETEAINKVFYIDWFPQIIYNHHQTGPAGTVLFAPPFRDPFNYYFDPLVPLGIDLVAAAMHNRFVAEDKPGATMRSGSSYSTWWNGGLRTTAYFHNMIGLLTEAIGNPTPVTIPLVLQNQLARGDLPAPIAPQTWHFRQSIDYSVTADRAVLDVASKYREEFLFNIYRMGRNSIDRGSRDNWTFRPRMIKAAQDAWARESATAGGTARERGGAGQAPVKYYDMLRDPAARDPRSYVVPSDQPDFLTAVKFVNALIKTGIAVHRATAPFAIAGRSYPEGSFVVRTAQAFRPHVLDMFEPQDHPDDFPYPGGPPKPPYDNAGWTLALQMGVQFDRILDAFEGPFEKIAGFARPPAGSVTGTPGAGYLLSHCINDAFTAVNRLLAAGEEVYWLQAPVAVRGRMQKPGTIYIAEGPSTATRVRKLAQELSLDFEAVATAPAGERLKLRPVRIGLWDRYGGSMPSGWLRWLLEQFEFPFEVVYPQQLDRGKLAERFDVLIFPTGAIPQPRQGDSDEGEYRGPDELDRSKVPGEFQERLGSITAGVTIPELRKFVEEGGTLLAIGNSTGFGYTAKLPVANALTEKSPTVGERPLAREKFYVPGSLLQARVDNGNPLAYGLGEQVDFFFDNSPAFKLLPEAALGAAKPVAWFSGPQPLRSGWAWGQGYLDQSVAVVDGNLGKGKLFLFGPEITFRAQPHGTFKFLFNAIYYGPASSRGR